MSYFTRCNTREEVRAHFHRLAKKHHPDLGGDTAIMQAIIAEYEKKMHSGIRSESEKAEEHWTWEHEEALMEKINQIITLENVKIEIIGTWLWVSGESYQYKDYLGKDGLKFAWSKSKKAWYWFEGKRPGYRRGHYSLNGLRERWGTEEVETKKTNKISDN